MSRKNENIFARARDTFAENNGQGGRGQRRRRKRWREAMWAWNFMGRSRDSHGLVSAACRPSVSAAGARHSRTRRFRLRLRA